MSFKMPGVVRSETRAGGGNYYCFSFLYIYNSLKIKKIKIKYSASSIKKPRRKPRLFSCFLKLIYKVCYFSHIYMVITLVYYSVNPLTSRVFKLSYSYIIVDISFIFALHLFPSSPYIISNIILVISGQSEDIFTIYSAIPEYFYKFVELSFFIKLQC